MIFHRHEKKKSILNLILLIFVFFYISFGIDWGLPSNDRVNGLFDNRDSLLKDSANLSKIYNQEKKKTEYKIYIKDYNEYVKSQSYQTTISLALSRFLVVPYAGDDAFILKALKNFNPEKLDFDPKYYMYGGGFVYSAAALLKALDLANFIILKKDILFYIQNPEEIANIYLSLRYLVFVLRKKILVRSMHTCLH